MDAQPEIPTTTNPKVVRINTNSDEINVGTSSTLKSLRNGDSMSRRIWNFLELGAT